MTIKEQLKNITTTAEQMKILDVAVENQRMVRSFLDKSDSVGATRWREKVYEDIQILELLNPFVNWSEVVYAMEKELDDNN